MERADGRTAGRANRPISRPRRPFRRTSSRSASPGTPKITAAGQRSTVTTPGSQSGGHRKRWVSAWHQVEAGAVEAVPTAPGADRPEARAALAPRPTGPAPAPAPPAPQSAQPIARTRVRIGFASRKRHLHPACRRGGRARPTTPTKARSRGHVKARPEPRAAPRPRPRTPCRATPPPATPRPPGRPTHGLPPARRPARPSAAPPPAGSAARTAPAIEIARDRRLLRPGAGVAKFPPPSDGGMAERSKAHAWKACIPFTGYRGFESLSLRH